MAHLGEGTSASRLTAGLTDGSRPRFNRSATSAYQGGSTHATRASPTLGYSTLTTRSSSLSRLSIPGPDQSWSAVEPSSSSYQRGGRGPHGERVRSPSTGGVSHRTAGVGITAGQYDTDAYGAWRRNGKEHTLLARARKAAGDAGEFPPRRTDVKGKGKAREPPTAVAFVVGIPSSSEDGGTDSDGASEGGGLTNGSLSSSAAAPTGPTVEEIIRFQIAQPVQQVDPRDLDSLLPDGIGDYTFIKRLPTSPSGSSTPGSSSSQALPVDAPRRSSLRSIDETCLPPPPVPEKVVLGRGKFSQVLLVRKDGVEYALKHTPLYVHHHLISARLLREPEILSELIPHPNLVKVFETMRTAGHAYLVEENLQSSITLEALVETTPGGTLQPDAAWSILEQLCSVVKALHEPLRVCHRDIKPENVLVRVVPPPPDAPPGTSSSLHLRLLDFGLATHFSASSAQLTTCCGSPAYHSPEIWRGLRDRNSGSGSRSPGYWGPEVDIWCIGLTILRCLVSERYPLGIGHTSLQSMADKVVTALLQVKDPSLRQVLATFLQLDGGKRMRAFDRFCESLPARTEARRRREGRSNRPTAAEHDEKGASAGQRRAFKSTTFVPSPLEHRLELYLDETSASADDWPRLAAAPVDDGFSGAEAYAFPATRISRSTSSKRTLRADDDEDEGAAGTPRAHDCLSRDSSCAPAVRQPHDARATLQARRVSRSSLSLLDLGNAIEDSSSPALSPVPSFESLSLRHPVFPPPIELVLLNPSNEPIRRAVSYIKYALRSKGILYHVRDDAATLSRLSISSASPGGGSQPPSLPPTPFLQPRSARQLTDSPASITSPLPFGTAEESYTCYLHCVVALPDDAVDATAPHTVTSPPDASSRLRAALKRSSTPVPAAEGGSRHPASLAGPRSASTPPLAADDHGRKVRSKGAPTRTTVDALTFYVSIRRRARDSRGRRVVVLSVSDQRAVPFVRDALASPPERGNSSTSESSQDEGRRGRAKVAGSKKKFHIHGDGNSGSRDARARRDGLPGTNGRSTNDDRGDVETAQPNGLGLEMGKPAGQAGGVWDFTLPSWVERLVGTAGGGGGGANPVAAATSSARSEQVGA